MIDDDGALLRARALSDRSRLTIHRLLLDADQPLTVAELAAATGLHRTAVGSHLAKLRAAGLVTEERLAPVGRGRPPSGFRALSDESGEQPYLALAEMLSEALRTGQSARDTGRSIGARAPVMSGPDESGPVEMIEAETRRLGFDPAVQARRDGGVDIVLRQCPYSGAAAADPSTICDLHLGLAEGLASRVGGVTVEHLHVADPLHGGCRLAIRHSPPQSERR